MENLLNTLNPSQKEAATCLNGPLLILAGAGSGKTRVLTFRIANLIAKGEATPSQILGVTFTNKAAKEMSNRVYSLLSDLSIPVYEPMWINTFHSSCVRILREDIHHIGYNNYFGIYDNSDQMSLVKKVLIRLNINEKLFPAKKFLASINQAKVFGLTPDKIEKDPDQYMDERSLDVFKTYEEEMKKSQNLDFSDLLIKTYELFIQHPEIQTKYSERFQYIMVDEYQDTNKIQYQLINALSQKHRNLCVVGDEDQSIYSWRGADITNILSFENDYPEGKVVKLEENYRSTQTIVKAASHVIQKNLQRKDKTLFTNNPVGELISVQETTNEYEEARFVTQSIKSLVQTELKSYTDFAIFYRTNAQSRVFEDQLRSAGIPYKIIGGMKFYDRLEIKNVMAYLKTSVNPRDDVAIKRIINVPARGIGKTTLDKLEKLSIDLDLSLLESIPKAIEQKLVQSGAQKKLHDFYKLIDGLINFNKESPSPSEVIKKVLGDTKYVEKLRQENTVESLARVDNIDELYNAVTHFEQEREEEATLHGFLEEMALVSDADSIQDDNSVTLMTLHISKGLEYPVVYIVGVENGLFPSGKSFDDPQQMEEERRLAYVGITRAKEKLFLTYAQSRRVWGMEQNHKPSVFIHEIPSIYLDKKIISSRSRFSDDCDSYQENNWGQTNFSSSTQEASYKSKSGGTFSSRRKSGPEKNNFDEFNQETTYSDGPAANDDLRKGMKVRHPSFGIGEVYKLEGKGENQRISVVFPNQTVKKFVAKYARLEPVS